MLWVGSLEVAGQQTEAGRPGCGEPAVAAQAAPASNETHLGKGGHAERRSAAPRDAAANRDASAERDGKARAHRVPITASGLVKSGPVVFVDASEKAGLIGWTHRMGTPAKTYLVETKGSGIGLIDFDNDGWMDIYVVNGSTFETLDGTSAAPHAALFHNNHDGTFTDVAARAGVLNDRWGMGVAIADFDNDGWPDLYVTNWGGNRLYRNNHDGTFSDIAEQAGVALGGWSTGATWGDFDGDGRLDLFVAGYLKFDRAHLPAAEQNGVRNGFCEFRGVAVACGPRGLKGETDHLFRNNGDGTFTDVSKRAGVADEPGYYGLGAVFADVNHDGRPDLLVGNDSTPNYLFLNNGDGSFRDASYDSGFAVNGEGKEVASMGLALGDVTHDGSLDVFDTTFSDSEKPLYRNDGSASFTDASREAGLGELLVPFLGFGDAFADFDNDGWKDLLIANGHVYPEADAHDWGTSWKQRPLLFRNAGDGRFVLVPAVEGTGLADVIAGRGMAVGDLFNDGKIDAVINVMDGHPVLLRNVSADGNHWLELKLVGGARSPRDAVGATVYVVAEGLRQREDVLSGGSYLSTNDPRPHFGLGKATKVEDVEVHWPSGRIERFPVAGVDRIVTLHEGGGRAVSAEATR